MITTSSATETMEEKQTGRLETFSNSEYTIAITLLVLDLKVPPCGSSRR